MAGEGEKIDYESMDKGIGGIPELSGRISQPYDYSEKQLEEKTHVPAKEDAHPELHQQKGKQQGSCGKAGCECGPNCQCGANCECGSK